MKLRMYLLGLIMTSGVAMAQQPPLYPPGPNYQGRPDYNPNHQAERNARQEWRRERRERERYCDQQRERVQRHPRLVLPRECWRR